MGDAHPRRPRRLAERHLTPLAAFLCSGGELHLRPDHLGRWRHDQPARGDPPVTSAENHRSTDRHATGRRNRLSRAKPGRSSQREPGNADEHPILSPALSLACRRGRRQCLPDAAAPSAGAAGATDTPSSPTAAAPASPTATAVATTAPWLRSRRRQRRADGAAPASPTAAPANPTAPASRPRRARRSVAVQPATFSAEAAYRHVEALAVEIGVQATGTEGERQAAVYIDEQLLARLPRRAPALPDHRLPRRRLDADGDRSPGVAPGDGAALFRWRHGRCAGHPGRPGRARRLRRSAARGKIALIERGAGLTFQERPQRQGGRGGGGRSQQCGRFLHRRAERPVRPAGRLAVARRRAAAAAGGRAARPDRGVAARRRRHRATPSQNVIAVRPDLPANLPIVVVGGNSTRCRPGRGRTTTPPARRSCWRWRRYWRATTPRPGFRFIAFGARRSG